MSSLIAWILRAIPFGTIIMYGALGETLTEKSGNLNLGVPGIMYLVQSLSLQELNDNDSLPLYCCLYCSSDRCR